MSFGGDFYALSDQQLTRLLDGSLYFGTFLYGEGDEKPRECYSEMEQYWLALSQLLSREDACGSEVTDTIPEATGYSYAEDVAFIAGLLAKLTDDELRQRHTDSKLDVAFEPLLEAVRGVAAFYQRAAANGDAVLFRVT